MPGVNRDELSVRVTDGELFIEANGKSRQVELIQPLNSDRHKFELKGDILEITLEI
jgi:HSP20 family molecular chaperone IbpA